MDRERFCAASRCLTGGGCPLDPEGLCVRQVSTGGGSLPPKVECKPAQIAKAIVAAGKPSERAAGAGAESVKVRARSRAI